MIADFRTVLYRLCWYRRVGHLPSCTFVVAVSIPLQVTVVVVVVDRFPPFLESCRTGPDQISPGETRGKKLEKLEKLHAMPCYTPKTDLMAGIAALATALVAWTGLVAS